MLFPAALKTSEGQPGVNLFWIYGEKMCQFSPTVHPRVIYTTLRESSKWAIVVVLFSNTNRSDHDHVVYPGHVLRINYIRQSYQRSNNNCVDSIRRKLPHRTIGCKAADSMVFRIAPCLIGGNALQYAKIC